MGCAERNPDRIPDPPTGAVKEALIADFNAAIARAPQGGELYSNIPIPETMVPDWHEDSKSLYNRLVRTACTMSFLRKVESDWELNRVVHPAFRNEPQCQEWLFSRWGMLKVQWKARDEMDSEAKCKERARKSVIKSRTGTVYH